MRKLLLSCSTFLGMCLVSLGVSAQEMPAGSVLVNTMCTINDGYDFNDVLEAAREIDYDREGGPDLMFFRRPIAANNAPPNAVLRVVYWQNLEHWATATFPSSRASQRLADRLSCDNANRRFFQNRNVGGGNAYNGGENMRSLSAAVQCTIKDGRNIAEVYQGLMELNAPMKAQGDTSQMQLSHRFLGPGQSRGLGAAVTIRIVGQDPAGLAARLDMQARNTGVAPDAPVENCSDFSLWESYVIYWGLPAQ